MTAKETPWGRWDHLALADVVTLFEEIAVPWWVAGGYAIDAFAGDGRREHDDIDIGIFASDHLAVRRHFADWDLPYADPPGTLVPWPLGLELPARVHDIWVRRHSDDSWRYQLMLNPGGPDELVYRRDSRVSIPMPEAVWWKDGIPFLAAEVQLLFKSGGQRPKDRQDFEDCLPLLTQNQREWLRDTLGLVSPGHEWIGLLMAGGLV